MNPHRSASATVVALLVLAALALVLGVFDLASGDAAAATTRTVGADISWPQCPSTVGIPGRRGEDLPMPPRDVDFVVIGLTNGPGFYPNPCIERHVRWVRRHHVYGSAYAMTTYPRPEHVQKYGTSGPFRTGTLRGRLRNTGYQEALFNVATMRRVGLQTPAVWVDVEPYPFSPWTSRVLRNRAVVDGAIRGYQDSGYRVGLYSTQYLWHVVVGTVSYGLSEWRPAGHTSMATALSRCSSSYSFQGGHGIMAQWISPAPRDRDVMCPGYGGPTTMRRWFHKY